MAGPWNIRKGNCSRIVPLLLLAGILLSTVPVAVSGSTPPPQPLVSVSVANRTTGPRSGIDVSVEYIQNGVLYPHPPDRMDISLYKIPDGSLLGTYQIPQTAEADGGATRLFRGTIAGAVLPAGDVMLVATDPESGVESRVAVSISLPGELYQAYRDRQVSEGMFYPAAMCLIIVLIVTLGSLVAKRA